MATRYLASERQWRPSGWTAVEACPTGDHAHSGASLFRMRAGAVIPMHAHPKGEHTYIIEGEALFGELHVRAGDAVYTPPGEAHEVRALTEVVFLGMAPH